MNLRNIAALALVIAAATLGPVRAQKPDQAAVMLEAARQKETLGGDAQAAIKEYDAIVSAYGKTNRAVAAQALLGMAETYRKIGNAQSSASAYERVLRDFSEQREATAVARTRLGGTGAPSARQLALRSVWAGSPSGTVSLDGRYLSSFGGTGNLVVHDIAAGTDRPLTNRNDYSLGNSAISRDGAQVAYTSYNGCLRGVGTTEDARGMLCLVSTGGSGIPVPRTLFASADVQDIVPMDWSKDGTLIAVSVRRDDQSAQIGLVAVATGALHVLKTTDWRGSTRVFFSPDGRDVAFDAPVSDTAAQRDVFVLAVDGTRGSVAVESPSQDVMMGWTPDGTHLLFASDRTGSMGLWAVRMAAGKAVGAPQLVKPDLGSAWSMGVTAGGALYVGARISDRDISVTTIDPVTGKQLAPPTRPIQRFIGSNGFPAWSRDGKFLAYVSGRGFNPTDNDGRIIAIQSLETGKVRDLEPRLSYISHLDWAPNGQSLVTAGTDLKGRSGVFRIDTQTGEVVSLLASTAVSYPKWAADGKHLFYRKGNLNSEEWTVVERDLPSGQERDVARGNLGYFSVSPDGRSLAVLRGGILSGAATSVALISVETGTVRELIHAVGSESYRSWTGLPWTPDGSALILRKRSPAELWIVPTTGAAPRRLDVDITSWAPGPAGLMSLHPDGRRLAFTSGNVNSEVSVLENFLPLLKK